MKQATQTQQWIIEAEQRQTGVCVAFFLDSATANRLALPDGEPASDLHITLTMLGNVDDFKSSDITLLNQIVAQFASEEHTLIGTTSGIGRFAHPGSDVDPVYASVDVKGLHKLRDRLCSRLIESGYQVDLTYAYTPHITLAYVDADAAMPVENIPVIPLTLDSLTLAVGEQRTAYPLKAPTIDTTGEESMDVDLSGLSNADQHYLTMEDLTVKQRAKIDDNNFAWPEQRKYPIDTQDHLDAAAKLIGRAPKSKQAAIKARAIQIAKRLKLTLPDTWKSDDNSKDAAESLTATEATFQPKPRLAQLKVQFLRDNAISRNGRQYPTETVNRLVNSGQNAIESGDIINAYICHGVADDDNPLVVSGKATKFWKEGDSAFAQFDIPDTTTGRDMVSLLAGGYIPPTMSLRATNAEMAVQRGKGIPQVVGDNIALRGVDFTSRPGIPDARIQDLTLENAAIESEGTLRDSFFLENISLISESEQEDESAMARNAKASETKPQEQVNEDANQILKPLVSGDSQGMDDSTPGSAYSQKYPQTNADIPTVDYLKQANESVQAIHDHVASALGMNCAPSAQEARKFSKAVTKHMVESHDVAAKHLGLECVGAYQDMQTQAPPEPADADDNDTDDNMESVSVRQAPAPKKAKEQTKMTPEEARAVLEAQGYTVQQPKTEAEKLQEAFEAKLAAQQKQFEEALAKQQEAMKTLFEQQNPAPRAQRKTLVESATNEQQPLANSPRARRSRIQENLLNAEWEELADRSAPLPEGVTPEAVLEHFGRLMVMDYEQKWGVRSIRPSHS
jgi:2'-5' RNA ligase